MIAGPLFVAFVLSGVGPALLLGGMAFVRWRRDRRAERWRKGLIGGPMPTP